MHSTPLAPATPPAAHTEPTKAPVINAFTFVPPPMSSSSNDAAPAAAAAPTANGFASSSAAAASSSAAAAAAAEDESEEDAAAAAADEAATAAYEALLARSSPAEKVDLAKAYLREGNTDKAVDMLAVALEEYIRTYGEFSLRCAPVYRSYGNALLQHYQKNSSVLGEIISGDEAKMKKLKGAGGSAEDGEDEDAEPEPEADNEDLSLSYQVLETARVILARYYAGPGKVVEIKAAEETDATAEGAAAGESEQSPESVPPAAAAAAFPAFGAGAAAAAASSASAALPVPVESDGFTMSQKEIGLGLAFVYELLGQWFLEKEDFKTAYGENLKALALSEPFLPADHRDLAGIHQNMAVAALFAGNPELALAAYKKARTNFELRVEALKADMEKEKSNPTPPVVTETAPAAVTSSSSSAAAASSSSAAAAAEPVVPEAPKTQLEKYEAELKDCTEILEELKERIDDIAHQLSLSVDEKAMADLKEHGYTVDESGNIKATPAPPAAADNPFANPFATESPPAAAAAASASAPAAAASSPAVAHAPTVKRKQPAKPAAPAAAPAAAAAPAISAAAAGAEPNKRQKSS